MHSQNSETWIHLEKAVPEVDNAILQCNMEDITQIFADLRDYWDTLDVGK